MKHTQRGPKSVSSRISFFIFLQFCLQALKSKYMFHYPIFSMRQKLSLDQRNLMNESLSSECFSIRVQILTIFNLRPNLRYKTGWWCIFKFLYLYILSFFVVQICGEKIKPIYARKRDCERQTKLLTWINSALKWGIV